MLELALIVSSTGIQLFQNMFFFICGYEDSHCILTNCKVESDNNQTLFHILLIYLLFVSCVFIDTCARLHLVVWFNVFGQFQYYIVDGWNIFLIMRPALFSFTDLYIKTANYYFEESKND